MTAFAELDIAARTEQLAKARRELDALTASAARTEDAAQDAGAAVSNAGRGMSVAGGRARILAQQLSQAGQQTVATGNFLQALAIQLPDIGLGFGAVGAAAGLLAGVALPIVSAALADTGSSAEKVQESVDGLSESVEAYSKAAENAAMPTDELTAKYGNLSEAAKMAMLATAEVEMVEAMDAADLAIQNVIESMGWFQEYAPIGMGGVTDTVMRLHDTFDLTNEQAGMLAWSLKQLNEAGDLRAQVDAASQVMAMLDRTYGTVERMPGPLRTVYGQMATIVSESAHLVTETEKSNTSAGKLAQLFDNARAAADAAATAAAGIGTAAAGAIGQVQGLANAMWDAAQGRIAANKAIESMQVGGVGTGGGSAYLASQYSLYGQGRVAGDTAENNADLLYNPPAIGTGVGSGAGSAGGGADPFQARLDALTSQFEAEKELADTWYEESQAVLADRRAMEILGAEEHARLMLAVEEEMVRRKMELRDQDLGHFESFFGSMAGAFSSGGERMLKISKAFALAEAAVSIWRGAAKALELPFPSNLAAWGQVIATGAKALTGIKSASPGSSAGLGGASTGGGRMATAEPAAQNRFLRIEVNGEGMFAQALRDNVQSIADAITDLSGRGGTTLVVGR